jgi:aerobic carbon-monoxide dehydrogenase medium subunit
LVDIAGVLPRQIEAEGGALSIGAGMTHAAVAESDVVARHLPVLAALAGHIGDPAVRNRGTLGGALAANEPAGDCPAAALALDAIVQTTMRSMAASDFFTDDRRTMLEPGEIITGTTFPVVKQAAYVKFLNPAARYAMVGVFVAIAADGSPRVAITGVRVDGAFRWRDAERALAPAFRIEGLDGVRLSQDGLIEDLFADAEYRSHLTEVLTRRAVALAARGDRAVMVLSHGTPMETPSPHLARQ